MSGRIITEIIETDEAFARLHEEWNGLLAESASDGVFLTHEWLHTWWRHLGGRRRLHVVTARADGRLVAIAPLSLAPPRPSRLMPLWRLEFLGSGSVGSDYLDVVIARGWEEDALEALAGRIALGGSLLHLSGIRNGPSASSDLAARLGRSGWSVSRSPGGVCPFADLRGLTWEDYLAMRGPEHRYSFRRKLRRLAQRYAVRLDRAETEEARERALDSFILLHGRRWALRGGSDAFHGSALRRFHHDVSRLMLQRGWLRLYTLSLDGRAAAAVYGFRYGKVFHYYQSGFDPDLNAWGPGVVALGLAIQAAVEEGAEEFDFLHGDEGYKFHWAKETRDLCRLELFPPTPRGWVMRGLGSLRRRASAARRGLARGKRSEQGRGPAARTAGTLPERTGS